MRRFSLYLLTASLTFGVSSILMSALYFCLIPGKKTVSEKITVPDKDLSGGNEAKLSAKSKTRLASPVCKDQTLSSIWSELKNDEVFKDWLGWKKSFSRADKCEELLRIETSDLNGDGVNEFLIRGDSSFCGATCNCAFWVLRKRHEKYQIVLSGNSYLDGRNIRSQIKETKTNEFKDIELQVRVGRNAHAYRLYRFDGKKYQDRRCRIHKWNELKPEEETKIMSCRKFERENHLLDL